MNNELIQKINGQLIRIQRQKRERTAHDIQKWRQENPDKIIYGGNK